MFTPTLPSSGLTGWRFLQRTYDAQFSAFSKSTELQSSVDYFAENIANVKTAEDLVSDRRLMEVALGAFGLQEDIDNRFFIQKMLEEGSTNDDALSNRFSDRRYSQLVQAFGLGPGERSRVGNVGFADEITQKYLSNTFEVVTGQQDDTMRIALYAQRTLGDLAGPARKPVERIAAEAASEVVSQFVSANQDDFEYYQENIGSITSAQELISDDRLLRITLGAFGLDEDYEAISSFVPTSPGDMSPAADKIQRVLEEGSVSTLALANQLNDQRYVDLSKAIGLGFSERQRLSEFGNFFVDRPAIGEDGFADEIIDKYIEQSVRIPESLNFTDNLVVFNQEMVLGDYASEEMSNDAKWFTIMGEPPLRSLFEKALNLPSEFGQVDIDQQLTVFKQRAESVFGSEEVSQFTDPEKLDDLITKFIARSQIDSFNATTSSASIALALLQS